MDLKIAGETALLMSSTRGLGFGCAAALVAEGVRVVISRNRARQLGGRFALNSKSQYNVW